MNASPLPRGVTECLIFFIHLRQINFMPSARKSSRRKSPTSRKSHSGKNILRAVAPKNPKQDFSGKSFARIIGCVEGPPDLSRRKGHNLN
jgi:hypothetical protein